MHYIRNLVIPMTVLSLIFTSPLALADKPDKAGLKANTVAQSRLADNKLKVCQAHEKAIQKRSTQLTKMAENMVTKFTSITTRVQTYYTDKAVPAGKTVTNYETLVADITTKQTAVTTALTTAQTDATDFSCTGDDPKGQLIMFRTDMQNVKKALKDYRTSIKNLIVAVRSATDNAESSNTTTPSDGSKTSTGSEE